MKKTIILLLFVFMIISCGPTISHISESQTTYAVDFREYANRGFLFTPYKYAGEYDGIGIVNFQITAEADYMPTPQKGTSYQDRMSASGEWFVGIISNDKILDYAYNQATAMGADAIADFLIVRDLISISTGSTTNINVPRLTVSGFAIKRK